MRRITNHDLRRLGQCAVAGLSVPETAQRCGLSTAAVRRYGKRLALGFAPARRQPTDPFAVERLRALLAGLCPHKRG